MAKRRKPAKAPRSPEPAFKMDPRAWASRLSSVTGPLKAKPGDWIVRIEATTLDEPEQRQVLFQAPLLWLLHLDFAAERAKRAEQQRRSVLASLRRRSEGEGYEPSPAKQSTAMDAVIEEAASIMLSYAAIEAFANHGLWWKGEDHRFEIERKRLIHLVAPDEVERTEKLRRKLWRHLPDVMEYPRPPDVLYRRFIGLERLRHALNHPKRNDRWGADSLEEGTVGKLLRGDVCGPRVAAAICAHFVHNAIPEEITRKIEALPDR